MAPQSSCAESVLAAAAYGLALRVAGDTEAAVASVEAASQRRPPTTGAFVRTVREEARARRTTSAGAAASPRLPCVAADDWDVLERVALRGMLVSEAAEAVGIERREALLRLHRGLLAAGRELLGGRQTGEDPDASRGRGLGGDLAAGGLHDPARDRQAQPAPVA
jgi:hypothetical protein